MPELTRIDTPARAPDAERQRSARFCSRCGRPAEDAPGRHDPRSRVCRACGLGVLLSCVQQALPDARTAFAIVTSDLSIRALSQAGENLLGQEQALLGTSLLELLTSPVGDEQLARHVARAAERPCEPVVVPVRRRSEPASPDAPLAAQIATCGPPRAALVTVVPSRFACR